MRLHRTNDVFWLESSYDEHTIVKAAGFLWHPRLGCAVACAACRAGLAKTWWTPRHQNALAFRASADGEAAAELDRYQASLAASRASTVDGTDFDTLVPSKDGLAYLPYQKAGIAYAMSRPNTLFGDEMGLGKSIEALGVLNADQHATQVMILCPASVKINWSREATKWLVRPFVIDVLSGGPQDGYIDGLRRRVAEKSAHGFIVVLNYDITSRWAEELTKARYDWLIIDEAHMLKNANSLRARTVLGTYGRKDNLIGKGLVHHAERILMLTGTPLPNKPAELFPLLRALDQTGLGQSFARFHFRYTDAHRVAIGGGRARWDFSGASRLDELQVELRARVMVRRLKKDVLTELPPKRHQIIELPPNGADAAVLAEREAFAKHEVALEELQLIADEAEATGDDEAFRTAMASLRTARQHAFEDIARERHRVGIAKIPHIVEHVQNFLESSTGKCLVFCWHRDVVAGIVQGLGPGTVFLTGDSSSTQRQTAIDALQNDPSVRVFIGNIQAAGVGITLTAADTVIFAELSYVPSDMMQAEDRAHRVGQKNSVLVQLLVFDGSLDARMSKVLVSKMDIISRTLDREAEKPTAEHIDNLLNVVRLRSSKKYPPASDEQREIARAIVQKLAGRCDGARLLDGMGFDRLDARFGHELARRATERPLTDGEVSVVRRFATKYVRQVGADQAAALTSGTTDNLDAALLG